jgi:hypothetical protein
MAEDKKVTEEVKTESDVVRTPRGQDSREAEMNTMDWENPVNLPAPTPQPGS